MADENGGKELIEAGARALGLKKDEIFSTSFKRSVATIVTIGGHKVRFGDAKDLKPLGDLQAGRQVKQMPPAPKASAKK